MLTEDFVIDFDDVKTMDVNLAKVKVQLIEELMYKRKEQLRALVEKIDFGAMTGMRKHQILHNACVQLKQMSPSDTRLLDNVERQVRWVLDTYYNWII